MCKHKFSICVYMYIRWKKTDSFNCDERVLQFNNNLTTSATCVVFIYS